MATLLARVEGLAHGLAQEYNTQPAWDSAGKADLGMVRLLVVLLFVLIVTSVIFLSVTWGRRSNPPAAASPKPSAPGPQIIELPENRDGPARSVAVYRTSDLKSWPDYAPAAEIHFDLPPVPKEVQQPTPVDAIRKAK